MKNPAEKVVAHGVEVWANKEMDALRRTECLCLNCARPDDKFGCCEAEHFYNVCVNRGMALMVTRCEGYLPKEADNAQV